MSDLAKEVANELSSRHAPLTWFQRASLIVAANILGLVLGAVLIAAGGIVWTKAMSTDDLKKQIVDLGVALRAEMSDSAKLAAVERSTILDEVARMKAELAQYKKAVESSPRPAAQPLVPPDLPQSPPTQMQQTSADDLLKAKAALQKKIDTEVFREKNLRE